MRVTESMQRLNDEVIRRFPETKRYLMEGDLESPYLVVMNIARWLSSTPEQSIDQPTVDRIVEFYKWCEVQPRTETADDDIWTIFIVGFYETLFEDDKLRPLIPHLVRKQDILDNENYLTTWVGAENYRKALERFGAGD